MVRGNWQRRVELNESRRLESKQKKLRQESKKIFKAQAQEFMAFLDRPNVLGSLIRSNKSKIMHIWVDTMPSDAPPILDMLEIGDDVFDNGNSKRSHGRQRAGRSRSSSIENEAATRKKAHPRSKEGMYNDSEKEDNISTTAEIPRLCRSHFFSGKCASSLGGGRRDGAGAGAGGSGGGGIKRSILPLVGSNCQFVHFPKKFLTLNDALKHCADGAILSATSERAFLMSAVSPLDTTIDVDDDSMNMLYYFALNMEEFVIERQQDGKGQPLTGGDFVTEAMADRGCSVASLVYLMSDDRLLYDRYRNGILVQEQEIIGSDPRRAVSGSEQVVLQFPASILEQVLSFSEDKAVVSMCAVCKAWHQEIGKQSGNLWRDLLHRRNWPVPVFSNNDSSPSDPGVERTRLRQAFVSHYVAVRDLKALQSGIAGLLHRKTMDDREGCFRSFDSARGSPQTGNPCVAAKIWSPNRILVAYQQDCSLRLFDSGERSGSSGLRLCRELIGRCMDPYQHTKKRVCSLLDMALDEDHIGTLLHVKEDGTKAEAFILTILGREDFLIDDEDEDYDATTQVIDIGQSVLNFLLSCEDVDHGLLQLHDFIRDGGELDDVEVLLSPTVISCGYVPILVLLVALFHFVQEIYQEFLFYFVDTVDS
jgi:hypothetical protein